MKYKIVIFCFLPALIFLGACSRFDGKFRAANFPPVAGRAFQSSFKYLGRSPEIGFRKGEEGIACDGTNYYLIYRRSILKVDDTWTNILAENQSPFSGLKGFDHLGAGEYYRGKLYIAAESYHGRGFVTNQSICIYSADTLKRISTTCISNDTTEASAVTLATNLGPRGIVFVSNYFNGSNLYKFDQADLSYIKALPLDKEIPELQGLAYHRGLIYAVADVQTNGVVYDIDPNSGRVKKLAFLTFPYGKEVEGCLFKGNEFQIMVAGGRTNNFVYYFSL
jgi:hypothetical protein